MSRVFLDQRACCAVPASRATQMPMTPDDVIRLLSLSCPVELTTADNAMITQAEIAQLLELATSMRPQLLALAAAAAAAECPLGRKRSIESAIAPAAHRHKPRAGLTALPMAASHSYIEKPRAGLAALPMAVSHSYIEKPR